VDAAAQRGAVRDVRFGRRSDPRGPGGAPLDAGQHGLFRQADPETADALRETYCRLVPADVLHATRRLLALYERICPASCEKAGTPCPVEDVIRLHRALDEFDRLT
jgi:hypothetical protein